MGQGRLQAQCFAARDNHIGRQCSRRVCGTKGRLRTQPGHEEAVQGGIHRDLETQPGTVALDGGPLKNHVISTRIRRAAKSERALNTLAQEPAH
jgi:hypothetical protein